MELTQKARTAMAEEEARGLVSKFCHNYSTRVLPSQHELCVLLTTSKNLPEDAVAEAFCESLSWSSGDLDWQPRLRVLHALKFFSESDGSGTVIAGTVARDAEYILEHLKDEVPYCSDMAKWVLDLAE